MPVTGDNSLYFSSGIDLTGLSKGVAGAKSMVQGLAQSIASINPFFALAAGATAAFAVIANSAFKTAKEFETAMKEVQTISKATQRDFDGLASKVFELSKLSPEKPVKLAQAFYQIVSAGYDGAKGLAVLETAAQAALAGVTTTETAADGLTTVLNAFKIEAREVQEVADAMFKTVELGKTNFEQLSASMSVAAPLAASLGVSYQEVLAAVASLTKQGVPTAQAFTQIRSALIGLNETLGNGWSQAYTLQEGMQELYNRAGGDTNKLQEFVGRIEAVSAVLGLAGKNAQGATQDLLDVRDALGAVSRASNIQMTGNVNQWELFSNNIKNTTSALGDFILAYSTGLARVMNSWFDSSTKVQDQMDSERAKLYILREELNESNITQERRKEILDELKGIYPEILGNLSAETTSTQDLSLALEEVNKQLVLKAAYQKTTAQAAEAAYGAADAEARVESALNALRLRNAAIIEEKQSKLNMSRLEGLEPLEKALEIQRQLTASGDFTVKFDDPNKTPLFDNSDAVKELQEANKALDYWNKNIDIARKKGKDIVAQIKLQVDGQELQKTLEEQKQAVIEATTRTDLEPYLKSQFDEVVQQAQAKLAELRKKYNGPGGGGPDEEARKAYTADLRQKEAEYERYENNILAFGREFADKRKAIWLQEYDSYLDYLLKRGEATQSALEKEVIAQELVNGKLIRTPQQKVEIVPVWGEGGDPVTGKPTIVSVIVDTDTTELEELYMELARLEDEMASKGRYRSKETIQGDIDVIKERIAATEQGVKREDNLYQWLENNIDIRRAKAIRQYIEHWQTKLKIAREGSEEAAKAEQNIRAGQDALNQASSDAIQQVGSILGDASDIFREFGANDIADLLNQLQGVAQGVATIARGDALSIIQGSLQVIKSAVKVEIVSDTAKFEKAIDKLNRAVTRLDTVISNSIGVDRIQSREDAIALQEDLQRQINLAEEAERKARKEIKVLGLTVGNKGAGSGTDLEKLQQLEDDADAARQKVLELKNQIDELYTGTTRDSIVSSLVEGFSEGKKSAEDFAGTFEELMRNAILESLKLKYLEGAVEEFFKDFSQKAESDGGLSSAEINALRDQFNTVIERGNQELAALNDILGQAGIAAEIGQRQGLAGEIQTVTEDTANILAGTLNKIMLDTAAQLDSVRDSVVYLSEMNVKLGTLIDLQEVNNARLLSIETALS